MSDETVGVRATLEVFAQRLAAIGPLDEHATDAVVELQAERVSHARGADVTSKISEGPRIVASGWACQMRPTAKRRRQIFGFYLPGDVIGSFWRDREVLPFQVTALTRLDLISLAGLLRPPSDGAPPRKALISAARRAEDDAEHRLFDHMARLSRRDAYRGLANLLLEFHDRLARAGLAVDGMFHLPVGQRVLAQTMGLSLAHTNQTLRRMASEGLFEARGNTVRLPDLPRITALADVSTQ
jgi:CRP-like cAMP-binding protein